jgi:hypothetical protein
MKRYYDIGLRTCLCAATLLLPGSVLAGQGLLAPVGLADDVTRATYFENFETFAPGGLAGQNGWTGWAPNISVTTDTPIAGAKSARHTSDGSGFVGFELLTPEFTPAYGVLAVDVRLSGQDMVYQFGTLDDIPTGNDGYYFNTGVQLQVDGTIRVLQAVGGIATYQTATATWTPEVVFQLGIETLPNGTLHIYKDGTLVFTGAEIGYAATGTAGRTKKFVVWTDNAPGSAGQSLTLDNFTNVLASPQPCPGDMNCDGAVNSADIDWFVEALAGESAWPHANCSWLHADCDGNGTVTFADIDPFVTLIGTTRP